MWLGIHNSDFDLVNLLDDPAFLGPVPKRREFRRRRLERLLEMRLVSHQHVCECHSVGPGATRVGATLEQEAGQRCMPGDAGGAERVTDGGAAVEHHSQRLRPISRCPISTATAKTSTPTRMPRRIAAARQTFPR